MIKQKIQEQYVSLGCRVPYKYKVELIDKAERLGISLSELVCQILTNGRKNGNDEELQKLKDENEKLQTTLAETKAFEEQLKQKEQEQAENLQFLREENQSLQNQIADLEGQIQILQQQLLQTEQQKMELQEKIQKQQEQDEALQEQVAELQEESKEENPEKQTEPSQEQQEQTEALQEQVAELQEEKAEEEPKQEEAVEPAVLYSSKEEEILAKLYAEGIEYITKPELKALGFNVGFFSKLTVRGATYGGYKLQKAPSEKVYKVLKLV